MNRRPPRSTRTDTLLATTTVFRSIPGATRSATARSNRRRVRVERLAAVRGDVDLAFPLAGLCGVVAVLHPHQRVHRYAKRLLDPQPHLRPQVRALVAQRPPRVQRPAARPPRPATPTADPTHQ